MVLLRKNVPQNHNLKTAAELGVNSGLTKQHSLNFGIYMTTDALIGLLVGIIGTAISIYQAAQLRERKKRNIELQYLLAGISNSALSKQQAWINQMSIALPPQTEDDLKLLRIQARARDDLSEIHSLVSALEGVMDAEGSAITSMLEKNIKQSQLNNKLQEVGLANPSLKKN